MTTIMNKHCCKRKSMTQRQVGRFLHGRARVQAQEYVWVNDVKHYVTSVPCLQDLKDCHLCGQWWKDMGEAVPRAPMDVLDLIAEYAMVSYTRVRTDCWEGVSWLWSHGYYKLNAFSFLGPMAQLVCADPHMDQALLDWADSDNLDPSLEEHESDIDIE